MSEGPFSPGSYVYNVSFCDSPSNSAPNIPTFSQSQPISNTRSKQNPSYGSDGLSSPIYPSKDALSTTKVLYCIHGNIVEYCEEDNHFEPNSPKGIINGRDSNHCHVSDVPVKDKKARRKLILASILCVFFMLGEAVGGYMSSSLAIATDAAHLLTDFASFMISLFALWVASRPATRGMSFGWYRAEVIGALTSVIMIWLVTGILVYMAIERIVHKSFEIEPKIMLITAGIGVVVNLIMGLTLHQHGHSHSGHDSHSSQDSNLNVRAAFIHVIGDFIQSFGVLVASIIIYFKPEWQLVDPICTFLFSILVMFTTFAIVRDTLMVLMEGKPNGVDFEQVIETFMNIDGVMRVHNVRIWALSLDKIALSAHLAIKPEVDPQVILMLASRDIRSKFNFFEMTLQIEQFDENMISCNQCKMPDK